MLESIGKEGFIGKSIGGESRRVEKLEIWFYFKIFFHDPVIENITLDKITLDKNINFKNHVNVYLTGN